MPICLGLSHKTFSSLALMFKTVRFPGDAVGAEITKSMQHSNSMNIMGNID